MRIETKQRHGEKLLPQPEIHSADEPTRFLEGISSFIKLSNDASDTGTNGVQPEKAKIIRRKGTHAVGSTSRTLTHAQIREFLNEL